MDNPGGLYVENDVLSKWINEYIEHWAEMRMRIQAMRKKEKGISLTVSTQIQILLKNSHLSFQLTLWEGKEQQ